MTIPPEEAKDHPISIVASGRWVVGLIVALVIIFFFFAHADDVKLITNRKGSSQLIPLTETRLSTPVYDLSFVAYDKAFSEEFGLVPDYVTDMDEHLRWMEIRMVTEGKDTNCYYTLVLDKAVKLDFPARNFNPMLHPYPIMPEIDFKIRSKHMKYPPQLLGTNQSSDGFWNRTRIASYDYLPGERKLGGSHSVVLNYYIQDRETPYKILSLVGSCYFASNIFEHTMPSVWLGNDSALDYNRTLRPSTKHFLRYEIPNKIRKAITPYLMQLYNSNRAQQEQ